LIKAKIASTSVARVCKVCLRHNHKAHQNQIPEIVFSPGKVARGKKTSLEITTKFLLRSLFIYQKVISTITVSQLIQALRPGGLSFKKDDRFQCKFLFKSDNMDEDRLFISETTPLVSEALP
jgi:hypothetical protein